MNVKAKLSKDTDVEITDSIVSIEHDSQEEGEGVQLDTDEARSLMNFLYQYLSIKDK